jgi:hypothetical protein
MILHALLLILNNKITFKIIRFNFFIIFKNLINIFNKLIFSTHPPITLFSKNGFNDSFHHCKNFKDISMKNKKIFALVLLGNIIDYYDFLLFAHLGYIITPFFIPNLSSKEVHLLSLLYLSSGLKLV